MPKVPVYVRQAGASAAPSFRQSVVSSEGAIYTATKAAERGQQAVSAGLSQFGAAMERIQEDRDSAEFARVLADASQRKSALLYGTNGLMTAKGKDAEGMSERIAEGLSKIDTEFARGLSANQARRFSAASANLNASLMSAGLKQQSAALAKYRTDESLRVLDNTVALMAQRFVADPGSPLDESSMMAEEDSFAEVASALYGSVSPENVRRVRQSAYEGAVLQIAQKDPLAAEKFFGANKSLFEASQRAEVEQKLEKAALPQRAQIQAEALWKEFGEDTAKGQDYIRDHYHGSQQSVYMSAYDGLANDKIRAANDANYKAMDQVYDLARRGKTKEALKLAKEYSWPSRQMYWQAVDVANGLSGVGRSRRAGSGTGSRAKYDPAVSQIILEASQDNSLYAAYPTFESFRDAFGTKIKPKELEHYRKIYEGGFGKPSNEKLFDDVLASHKIKSPAAVASFRDAASVEYQRFFAVTKRPPDEKELVAILEGLCETIYVNEAGKIVQPAMWHRRKVKKYELGGKQGSLLYPVK